MIYDEEANPNLRSAFEMAKTPHGTIDNVLRVHSLRPSTMKGHMSLYKSVLHDENNTIPQWFQETISSYVSILNKCKYSLDNHWKNASYLINNDRKSKDILNSLKQRKPKKVFKDKELAILNYAEKLTIYPQKITKKDFDKLKKAGLDDGEILEANQIICYFNYVNRSINGLGVTTKGDIVGYYQET